MFYNDFVYGNEISCDAKQKIMTNDNPEKALIYPNKSADMFYDDNGNKIMIVSDETVEIFIITIDGHSYQGIYGGYVYDEGEYYIKVGKVLHIFDKIIFLGTLD